MLAPLLIFYAARRHSQSRSCEALLRGSPAFLTRKDCLWQNGDLCLAPANKFRFPEVNALP